mmetsp:Transcript_114029/g.333258  ORF Transcript_114029/g.333258 Transcript_114029/m.333258 type:complete len:82 (+) Transcript_114029:1160-1405(+)
MTHQSPPLCFWRRTLCLHAGRYPNHPEGLSETIQLFDSRLLLWVEVHPSQPFLEEEVQVQTPSLLPRIWCSRCWVRSHFAT